MQLVADGGKSNVDDGEINSGHEVRNRQQRKGPPAVDHGLGPRRRPPCDGRGRLITPIRTEPLVDGDPFCVSAIRCSWSSELMASLPSAPSEAQAWIVHHRVARGAGAAPIRERLVPEPRLSGNRISCADIPFLGPPPPCPRT